MQARIRESRKLMVQALLETSFRTDGGAAEKLTSDRDLDDDEDLLEELHRLSAQHHAPVILHHPSLQIRSGHLPRERLPYPGQSLLPFRMIPSDC